MESRKAWEERIVDDAFPLRRYLGGDSVFLTEYENRPAAIKIAASNSEQLRSWQAAEKLSHDNLIRLFRSGRCQIDGKEWIYAVMELADEDLSQVLPERALTPEEAREMLAPAVAGLSYLHSQGLVHGRLKPSNIMAIGDRLKLSVDHVSKGDPADDLKGLGKTLVEALTQRRPMWPHLPESLEQPFRDIAEHTLHPDPKKQWTLAQISARLDGRVPTKRTSIRWQFLVPIAAAGLAILIFAWRSGGSRNESPPVTTPSVAAATSEPTPVAKPAPPVADPVPAEAPAVRKVEPIPDPRPEPVTETKPAKPGPETKSRPVPDKAPGVEQEILPEIPQRAVSTVHGTMIVTVRVQVDSSGNVSDAKLEPPAASRYFAKYILDASKRWKFEASDHTQVWNLRYVITKKEMKVTPRKVS